MTVLNTGIGGVLTSYSLCSLCRPLHLVKSLWILTSYSLCSLCRPLHLVKSLWILTSYSPCLLYKPLHLIKSLWVYRNLWLSTSPRCDENAPTSAGLSASLTSSCAVYPALTECLLAWLAVFTGIAVMRCTYFDKKQDIHLQYDHSTPFSQT